MVRTRSSLKSTASTPCQGALPPQYLGSRAYVPLADTLQFSLTIGSAADLAGDAGVDGDGDHQGDEGPGSHKRSKDRVCHPLSGTTQVVGLVLTTGTNSAGEELPPGNIDTRSQFSQKQSCNMNDMNQPVAKNAT